MSRSSASAIVVLSLSWCVPAGSWEGLPLMLVHPLERGSSIVVVAISSLIESFSFSSLILPLVLIGWSASSVVMSEPSLAVCVGSKVLLAFVESAAHVLIVELAARAQLVEEKPAIRFAMLLLLVVEILVLGSKMRTVFGSGVFLALAN